MLRVARSENELSLITCLDVTPNSQAINIFEAMEPLLTPLATVEDEIAERNGMHYIPRLEMDDTLNGKLFNGYGRSPLQAPFAQEQMLQLRSKAIGSRPCLVFDPVSMPPLGDDEIEIEIKAARVTQRDALLAQKDLTDARLGTSMYSILTENTCLTPTTTTGGDCAGVVVQKGQNIPDEKFALGDRVVAIRPLASSLRNRLRIPASFCRRLQDDEPFHLAVLWPTILAMVHYALVHLARVIPGETVLIFSAESETGQIMLQLAKVCIHP